jgi:hypothetical protein
MIEVENKASFLAAIRSGINLFAGAGWSVLAESSAGRLPVGDQLSKDLRVHFGVDPHEALDLPQLHTVIASKNTQDLEQYLRTRFSVTRFDPRYSVLERMALKSIFTTNIDDLFERVLAASTTHFLNDAYSRGTAGAANAIDIVKLHGSVLDENRPFVFGPLDIAVAATADPDRWMLLRQRLHEAPTLFAGYAVRDAGTLQMLRAGTANQEIPADAWVQIRPSNSDPAMLDYFRALGFQIIVGETDELLDLLDKELGADERIEPADPVITNIPSSGQVAARPLEDFFLGAAPTWSDIYAQQVPRTEHYRTIANNVAANANTLISGIPGSGKTTLLMQIAAHVPFDGPRVMLNSPSAPEAQLLGRQIGNRRALVLVDNVSGDIEALVQLTRLSNAVVIAADRDYNLSSVSHRIAKSKIQAQVAISSVVKQDLQKVWNAIPVRVRRRLMEWPETSSSLTPTVHEMVRANVSQKSLDERLIEYANSIYRSDPEDAYMLMLACYMHYGRVPLSMDVVIAFYRDTVADFRDLYAMLDAVGDLLGEHTGAEAKNDQDYFAARSLQVAENVLHGVPGSALRALLERFQQNISPMRVVSYDVFRRRAYDYRLYRRAFPSWQDGAEEYDKVKEKIRSFDAAQEYYVEQQKALFLSEHKQYEEAFREIDHARGARKRVNWTIENTYNRILFRANVDKAALAPEAENLCFRALDGLEEAHEKDERKGQHALVFSDSALRLSRAVDQNLSVEYLEKAEEMLKGLQVGPEAWLDRPRFVLREVRQRLRDLS